MSKETNKKIEQLREQIRKNDYLYYVLNQPEITDREYDKLFAQLKKLEKENPELVTPDSPTQRVSGQPLEGFTTVRHSVPMLSIDNTYNDEELREFDKRIRKQLGNQIYDYTVEPKIDGLAISLRYEKGELKLAATRGDGYFGDDVTANVKTIKTVPLRLLGDQFPDVLEVRGEVYMPIDSFKELNRIRSVSREQIFANPRNAAAGSLKLLDSNLTMKRNLSFYAYALGEVTGFFTDNHPECLQKFKDMGLPVNPHITYNAHDINEVISICWNWSKKRYDLKFLIDGLVIKINRFDQRKILGATGHAPRWCISYKFEAEQAETVVESIDVQVGKSGILTPVANLTPVLLAGTTVKRASLHNFEMLAKLDVRNDDIVVIEKAGEIIPQVANVKIRERKDSVGESIKPPSDCPVCGHKVIKDINGVYIRCNNLNCIAKLKERLEYFVGKGQMDIENLGPAVIEQLVDRKKVRDFSDLYKLELFDLTQLDRIGIKSAENILESLKKSKSPPLWRFIAALGIPNVGGHTAQVLADNFNSINDLMEADEKKLKDILEIGQGMAQSIYNYFHNNENEEVVKRLLSKNIKPQKQKVISSKTLSEMTIVVTGSLENFTRQQIEQTIKDHGGKSTSSVSKNTTFVLAGENPGSKIEKAQELSVKIIDEKQFMELIQKDSV